MRIPSLRLWLLRLSIRAGLWPGLCLGSWSRSLTWLRGHSGFLVFTISWLVACPCSPSVGLLVLWRALWTLRRLLVWVLNGLWLRWWSSTGWVVRGWLLATVWWLLTLWLVLSLICGSWLLVPFIRCLRLFGHIVASFQLSFWAVG